MNIITRKDDKFVIRWTHPVREKWFEILNAVKLLPGATPDIPAKCWYVPNSAEAVMAITDFARDHDFVIHTDAAATIEQTAAGANKLLDLALGAVTVDDNFGLIKELWSFQKVGVQYGILAGSHLNGDDPGLGKTPQAIGVVHALKNYPVLVVTIKRNKIPFMRKWQEYTGMTSISVWTNEARGNAQVDIIDYNLVTKMADYIIKYRKYKAVIFDEIHYARNKATKRATACMAIAKAIPLRYGYSGSLLVNHMNDLYAELELIGRASMFGNQWKFQHNYCHVKDKEIWMRNPKGVKAIKRKVKEFYGVKNQKQLFSTLRANCFIGRKRREVRSDLPPLTIDYIDIGLSDEMIRAEMQGIESELMEINGLLEASRPGSLEYQVLEKKASGSIFKLRRAVAMAKLPGIKEWLEDFIETGEKIIIYAHHQSVQEAIASWFPTGAVIKAGQSEDESQRNVDRFTNDPDCQTITCSIMAGQEAIDLQAACYMAIVEEPWTQKDIDQMHGKMDRGAQDRPMMVYHLACMEEGSVDQIIMEIRKTKQEIGSINSTKFFIDKYFKR